MPKDGFGEKAKKKNKADSTHTKKKTKNDANRYDPDLEQDDGKS